MARTKATNRKSTGGTAGTGRRVWHPALTTAAELGEAHLEAAREAEVEHQEDGTVHEVHPMACVPHSRSRLPLGAGEPSGPASPFPLDSSFGLIAYAVWHGHDEVVKAYLEELEADVDGAAVVSCACPASMPPKHVGQRLAVGRKSSGHC